MEESDGMKKILLVATGGTIASVEDGRGLAPALSGEELARYVPEIADVCDFDVVQPMNIDSTNMRPADWMRIRDEIVDAYDAYDGFVVLHGTDTMAYTAAALSYLVQGSPKPIVLTGSQQPMASPFTDAKLNLYQSLLFAADDRSCDVSVVFGGAVIAGTRARKQRTMSFNAFTSVNFPEIALVRGERIVRAGSPATCAGIGGAPRAYDSLNERVFVLKLTPEMNPSIFNLLKRDYDAVILETFGIGGIPDYGDYRRAIFGWVDSGRTLVVTTQVPEEGCDLGVYEVGRAYAGHRGILKGGDMTTEALVAKDYVGARADERPRRDPRPVLPHGEPRPAGGRGLNALGCDGSEAHGVQRLVDGARAVERALVEGDVGRLVVLGKCQVRQADVRDASAAREGEVRFEGLGIEGHVAGAQLVAQTRRQLLELGCGGDAQPQRRVGCAAELPQAVAAQRDGGRAGAGGFQRVGSAAARQRFVRRRRGKASVRVVGVALQEAPLHRRAQPAGERRPRRQRSRAAGRAR